MLVEELKVSTGESTKTVKELRTELKSLKDQLLNTQQGTKEYNSVMQEAANIQHELKDQMEEVNNSAMDLGQRIGNCTKTITGISGAITAATGALSLFGIENEEAQKKITATMSALIGITEGMSKIDDGVKAFKRLTIAINAGSGGLGKFKVALASTGIGALVVVLGSIIAYWDEFTAAIGLSSEQMEHLGDVAKGVFNVFTSSLKGIAQAIGKMISGDFQGAWDSLKNGFNVVQNFNDGVAASEKAREEEKTRKAKEEADKRAKIAEEEYNKRIEAAAKLAKYEKDMANAKTRGDDSDKYSETSYNNQMAYYDRLLGLYKKDSEEYKNTLLEKEQYLQDWDNHKLEIQKKEDEQTQATLDKIKESNKTEQELLNEKYENLKTLAQGNADALLEIDTWYKRESDKLKNGDSDNKKLLDSFDEEQMTEQEHLDERYQQLVSAAEAEITNEDELAKKKLEIDQWYADETKKIDNKTKKDKLNNYTALANNVADLFSAMSDSMEEGSEEQKAMQTASAVINMIAGISNALSMRYTTHTGFWDWALGISQAATIAATGVAQIKKINSVSADGSNASSAASSASSAYSTSIVNMASVQGSSGDFTQSVDGASTTAALSDTKVYVTEHDITETQNKVAVTQSNATY